MKSEKTKAVLDQAIKIPKDWTISKLGDVSIIRGRIGWKGLKKDEYVPNGVYLIAGKHIKKGRIQWERCDFITEERYKESIEIALQIGDVIFSKDGSLGNPALIRVMPGKATINSTMMLVRANKKFLNVEYLFQILKSRFFEKLINEKVSGSSIPHIFQADMKDFSLILPPIKEQQKISTILNSWDEVIENISDLIQRKERRKKALMQQLFTGKKRFKEFKSTKWKEFQIQNIATVFRGSSPRPKGDPRYYGGNIPRLMVEDVTRDGKYVFPKVDFLTEEGAKLSRPVPKGTLVLVCSGDIGVPSILGINACIHDGFIAFKEVNKNVSVEYLFYLFTRMRDEFNKAATHGGVFTNMTTTGIKEQKITLPSILEQNKIVAIISKADEEIQTLKTELEHCKKQKRGLMQILLTGKKRVKTK